MTNEEYILTYREADIRSLALKKVPEGVDALWCMRQIEGYQLARKKLPRWAETEGLWFPPRLSMEQCSSETTAGYKSDVIRRLTGTSPHRLADLTGGFGVDFSYMAGANDEAFYVERQEELCRVAEHNMPLLGLPHVHIINKDTHALVSEDLSMLCPHGERLDVIFLDPARRDTAGRKTVAIEDCTPDVTAIQDKLLSHSTYVIIKLSPMLDITQALRSLRNVTEVHVVSVRGECKELLFVLSSAAAIDHVTTYCVNLDTADAPFISHGQSLPAMTFSSPAIGQLLYEPNASIMKAGVQDCFAMEHRLTKLHPMSNLYLSDDAITSDSMRQEMLRLPARIFRIYDIYDFSKQSLKRLRTALPSANITVRNFPASVDDIRRRLKIKEGGDNYLFVTTTREGNQHIILHCRKV